MMKELPYLLALEEAACDAWEAADAIYEERKATLEAKLKATELQMMMAEMVLQRDRDLTRTKLLADAEKVWGPGHASRPPLAVHNLCGPLPPAPPPVQHPTGSWVGSRLPPSPPPSPPEDPPPPEDPSPPPPPPQPPQPPQPPIAMAATVPDPPSPTPTETWGKDHENDIGWKFRCISGIAEYYGDPPPTPPRF